MNLYFEISKDYWIKVSNCKDWNDAIYRLSKWWDLHNIKCIDENEFKKIKRKLVLVF